LIAAVELPPRPVVGSPEVNAVPNPAEPPPEGDQPRISLAAERARAQLHEEIERVRGGVEEMLAEQGRAGAEDAAIRRELDALREDARLYVKKRTKRTERKLERRIEGVEERTERLEARIEEVQAERAAAEVRIHTATELMLDGLLREVRAVADLLSRD
jgi:chromosome segregation ATPase